MGTIENIVDVIHGQSIRFDDGREVFIGRAKSYPDRVYLQFISDEGRVTRLVLSNEAMDVVGDIWSWMRTGVGTSAFKEKAELKKIPIVKTERLEWQEVTNENPQ